MTVNKEKLAPGIYSYSGVFPESLEYISKIEELVNLKKIAWVPSFNKKHTSEEDAKKFFRQVETIGLPLEFQVPDNVDKKSESNSVVFEFSKLLKDSFDIYLKEYVNEYGISLSEQEPFGLLKYGNGSKFGKHIDNGMMFNRTVSLVYYANDDYVGGEIYFDQFDLKIVPQKNQLLLFPSNYIYSHSISEVSSGIRYAIVSFYK
jgi:hypothetical protein